MNVAHPSYTPELKRKPVIVCGDLNVAAACIDLANPNANRMNPGFTDQEREKFSRLLDNGYVDTFRYLHPDEKKYSWWSYRFNSRARNVGWRIDYFLLPEWAKDTIQDADILTDIHGSDHAPVILKLNI